MSAFELKNVTLKFGDRVFLKNFNIQFQGPGVIGILGPSGCGKSTLLRLLAGLQKPTEGMILAPDGHKGFVFQESHLLPWRSSFENVSLPLELSAKLYDPDKIKKLLKNVGLEQAENLYPSQLSGGMKMRVSLARALVNEPKTLFCDEPFSALDEITRENLQDELRKQILERQATCFFVTHSLSEALIVSDRIYIFKSHGVLAPHPFHVSRSQHSSLRNDPDFQSQLQTLRTQVRGSFS